jgi:hypothetical protein
MSLQVRAAGLARAPRTVAGRALRIGHGVAERGRPTALARQHQLQGAGVFFITHDRRGNAKRGPEQYREISRKSSGFT